MTVERGLERTTALAAAVDAVVARDLSGMFGFQLQELVADLAPQVQRLTGFLALATAELQAATGGTIDTDDGRSRSTAGWVSEATRSDPATVGRTLRAGGDVAALPAVAAAVLDGTIGWASAQVLARLVGKVDLDSLRQAQPSLLAMAALMDPVALARYVRHLIATWCEPALEAEAAHARDRRALHARDNHDGTVSGRFLLPAEDYETVATVLEPLARKQGDTDSRSAAQRRADAMVDVCEQVARHGQLPDAGGQRPQLSYVLPADWAARQSHAATCPHCRPCREHRPLTFTDLVTAGLPPNATGHSAMGSPARATGPPGAAGPPGSAGLPGSAGSPGAAGLPVPGADGAGHDGPAVAAVPASHACAVAAWTGPQTRARIETLLCDARLSRVLISSLGQVRGLEALTDTVTAAQRRALAARDLGCAARGCTRPPAMCDAHHLTARADGGLTTLHNLVLLCRRHHVLWHLGKIGLADLHVPWLTTTTGNDPPLE